MYLLLISTFLFCEAAYSANFKAQAAVVDLDQYNTNRFVKNKYAVAFFCDFDKLGDFCEESKNQFLTAADKLTEEKIPIKFGIMDQTKNKWLEEKNIKIHQGTFIFFCSGRYVTFWDTTAEGTVKSVKDYKKKCDKDPYNFFREYKEWNGGAPIIDLNQKNIETFVKNNYAVAFFCDYENFRDFCEESEHDFLKAADQLTAEKLPIKFGKMDHTKNKWIEENIQVEIKHGTLMFFCSGRYENCWDAAAEGMVKNVKKYKEECDKNPTYFHWIYNKRL